MLKKNAMVTGSTSGMGLAIARALAREGCNLMIGGFAPAGVPERLCKEISAEHGVTVLYSGADLSKPAAVRQMVADTITGLGSLDILVNNAGLQHVAPITEFPDDKWELLTSVLLDAPFHAIKAALPGMIERKWGRIVNTASVMGTIAAPHKPAYVASKHGLIGLTKAVGVEVAETGVTCNAIGPATVLTDVILSQLPAQAKVNNCTEDEAMQRVFLSNMPTRRIIDPDEIAGLVLFLCSEAAKSITGTTIFIDGGYTAR